jgi:hypothetical protein
VDLAAVFGLSLVGGYWFCSLWRVTAFSTRRIEGHHLYFRAALYGALLFVLALALRNAALGLTVYARLDNAVVSYVEPALKEESGLTPEAQRRRAEWLVTAAYSLLVGPLVGGLFNVFTSRRWAQQRSLGALNRLLLRAQREDMPVQLTLNTGKIYIGLVAEITNPDREADVIRIIPMFSGYRDAKSRMALTTDYESIYGQLASGRAAHLGLPDSWLSQFELVISADTIVSAALFSPAVYAEFNPHWQQAIRDSGKPAPTPEMIVEIKRPRTPAATSGSNP